MTIRSDYFSRYEGWRRCRQRQYETHDFNTPRVYTLKTRAYFTLEKEVEKKRKKDGPFPSWLSFLLNNPFRRHFDPAEKIVEILGIDQNCTVLDFGAGPGFYTIPFGKKARKVVAVDLQPEMLEKLARYAEKQGVAVQCMKSDGKQIPLPSETFDLIFLSHVYHEIEDKPKVLRELKRVLKPEGRLAIMERIRGRNLPFGLGPPVLNQQDIHNELKTAGFSDLQTINLKNRGIIMARDKKLNQR